MSDIREALVALLHNEGDGGIWEHFDRKNSEAVADAILAAGWTPPTVKPPVEALADALMAEGIDAEPGELDLIPLAERLLAMLPGRSEAEVKVEALREAASAAVAEEEGVPWDDDHDRATVGAWLLRLADSIGKEVPRG